MDVDIGSGKTEKFDLGGQWLVQETSKIKQQSKPPCIIAVSFDRVTGSQPDVMEILDELGLETYPQFINGTKVMQVGSDNKIRTYTSDIPSLGSVWGVIELQIFIWKVIYN